MISKYFSDNIKAMFLVFVGLLLFGTFPSDSVSIENTDKIPQDDIQPVGIINPDGAANLWSLSISRASDILGLLAKYPSEMMEGIQFYRLSSWQDMARILTAFNEHQTQVIRHLAQDVQKLNERVKILEKKRQWVGHSGSINSRVQALEKKVKDMSDGGNP